MIQDTRQPGNAAASQRDNLQITVTMEQFNSAFGISAETLHALANSYGVSAEQLIVRAVTMWAKADIPDLDLDSPRLTDAQFEFLAKRRQAQIDQTSQTLQETFNRLFEGKGDPHENAELTPRNGGNS